MGSQCMLWVWLETWLSKQLLTHVTLLSYLVPLNLNLLMCKSKEKYVFHKITVSSSTIITKASGKAFSWGLGDSGPMLQCGGVYLALCATFFFCVPQDLLVALSIASAHSLPKLSFIYSSTSAALYLWAIAPPWAYSSAWCLWMRGEIFLWHFLRIVITCRRSLNC